MVDSWFARKERAAVASACALAFLVLPQAAVIGGLTQITLEAPPAAAAGDTFSFLVKIAGTVPLIGYSLELSVFPEATATGSITGDPLATNFFLSENLLEQGGGGLHPTLSTIGSLAGNTGLGITGIDANLTATAIPATGQDVLAEVWFDVSGDASGIFTFELSRGTGLADNNLEEVPWESSPVTVVVPEPGYLGIIGGAALLLARRRRKSARADAP